MIKVHISGNRADVIEREPLTSGTVGKVVNFAFTEDWRSLIKYAVFEGSGRRIVLTNTGDSCIIPHEVLAKHGGALRVGVYGRTADGSAATPTVYAQLGIIQRGADPNADPSTKPTLPVWAQIQAQIGDLSNLTTEDKTNLVAAINEAAKSGGGGSGGKDGTGIESITYKGKDEAGGNMYTVLLTDGTSYDITAPKGADGAAGITPHIGDNGNWYLGTTDTGKPSHGETGLQGPAGPVGPQGPQGEKGEDAAADRTLGLTGATVGQIAKIAAVDASGVPTAWSPVDMPSGGGETWEKLVDVTLAEAVASVTYTFDNCKRIRALIAPVLSDAISGWRTITINNASYPAMNQRWAPHDGLCLRIDSEVPPYVQGNVSVIANTAILGINGGYYATVLENIAPNGITQFGCQTAAVLTAGTKIEIWGVKS